MTVYLSFVCFALAVHLLDAARHYWHEDESFSSVLNFIWGAAAVLIGLSLL
jgi:hypothetical protein